jgi:hypothetical protein
MSQPKPNWSEAEIGALLGLSTELPETTPDLTAPLITETSEPTSSFELEFESEPLPITQHSFAQNPWAKLGLVGGGTAVIFALGGFVISSLSQSASQIELTQRGPEPTNQSDLELKANPTLTPEQQLGILKTEIAIASQEKQLKSLEQPEKTEIIAPSQEAQEAQEAIATTVEASEPPKANQGASATKQPPVQPPQQKQNTPKPPVTPNRVQVSQPVIPPAPPPLPTVKIEKQPQPEWMALAQLGSFGSTIQDNSTQIANPTVVTTRSTRALEDTDQDWSQEWETTRELRSEPTNSGSNQNQGLPRAIPLNPPPIPELNPGLNSQLNPELNSRLNPQLNSGLNSGLNSELNSELKPSLENVVVRDYRGEQLLPPLKENNKQGTLVAYNPGLATGLVKEEKELFLATPLVGSTIEERDFVRGQAPQQIQVGQQVTGQVLSPLVWADSLGSEDERFVIVLDEPIFSNNQQVVLPVGTQIIVQITSVHDSGLVITKAVSFLREGVEYELPPLALSIRGKGGQPLLAEAKQQGVGKRRQNQLGLMAVGALAQVGEVMNRPESVVQTINTDDSFRQTSSVTQGETSVVGAVLEGGLKPLTEQLTEQNQREIEAFNQRSPLWEVKAGTKVQVVVNRSFQL